ncbi:hypothetical protein GCK72_025394 [Caenorhabditis remanei]|uniref:Uncharacterized protein n=1 Tax=Caenorhabditis remanei TaxID=31234 RepID=A0A6A5G1U3_CAERE|nr:hypothetical protein GCK72_025394 [Caenorhabditis remanei]KAF1748927.1 hypothetical protein GCK72_025394 [Caenorhabditis remanei]
MGHPTEKATNISAEDFSSSDPITPSGPHHQQSASEPGRVSTSTASAQTPSHPHNHQKGILNRLPDYFRDTVGWFIGYALFSFSFVSWEGNQGEQVVWPWVSRYHDRCTNTH